MIKYLAIFLLASLSLPNIIAQDKFKQLGAELPTPNTYRTAAGTPGHEYWQQKVDYDMDIRIDEDSNKLHGTATINYTNNSPDVLTYLWLQLDQNVRAPHSMTKSMRQSQLSDESSISDLAKMEAEPFKGGYHINSITDVKGNKLKYIINNTMMKVELPTPLKSGETFVFNTSWWYNINNTNIIGGRSGYEPFDDGNNVYCIAQFFPRMCKYYDVEGWQNKQFFGRGEFTLEFGDYNVNITVPKDHLVASTGTLSNANAVLSKEHRDRLKKATKEFVQPVMISTLEEAKRRSKKKATDTQVWNFKAENVRDFAFASSRRFIWDAMNTKLPSGKTAMAQSMWVPEGDCLWKKYSTKTVAHTLKWYSHYAIEYPYPVGWSIDGSMGMEYPMICFNYGRCESDGTYSQRMKYGHIGVIIHEVGHFFFPMIINSDERQWTWMDEGVNCYVQYLTEQQFERNYPSRSGIPSKIVPYMKGDKSNITPIMTNSESVKQFGYNAYRKPATAFNILRESIVGRELFDDAFRSYSESWAFKTPTPADLFRHLEDATGTDLDWFWRGWFYSTDHVDIAISTVKEKSLVPPDPDTQYKQELERRKELGESISDIRNKKDIKQTYTEIDPTLVDLYTHYDAAKPDAISRKEYKTKLNSLTPKERELIRKGRYYYEIEFENKGGLPMPLIFNFEFIDGTKETKRVPAEIWRKGDVKVKKAFAVEKKVKRIVLDPYHETADVDRTNNYYPPQHEVDRFELYEFKEKQLKENPMQRANRIKDNKY